MDLLTLHNYFKAHGVEMQHLTGDYKHCVYKCMENGRVVTVPKTEGDLKQELIAIACFRLQIEQPILN